MGKQIVAMVLAGGRVDELSVLTAKRPKSAVPVWGMYRFIDFVLSNLMHSGIEVVGVLSQYRPYSLIGHLAGGAPWDYVGRTRALKILSPFQGFSDSDWYKGTADAIYQNLDFLEHYTPELVLVASGDHVYSMDYRPMIRQHLANRAELTIALTRVPCDQAHRFGTAVLDDTGRVLAYEEKAAAPRSDLASLTVYVFDARALERRVRENAAEGRTFQVYSEIIPRMVAEGARVFGHVFSGYWAYARTLEDYLACNMAVLGAEAPDLEAWQLRTNLATGGLGDPTPARFARGARVRRSMVCGGATVEGEVEGSILSPGVTVAAGALVRDSIVMHDCTIGAGTVVDRAVLDKQVRVGPGSRVGWGDEPGIAAGTSGGVAVIGKGTRVPGGYRVGRGCLVAPDLDERDWPAGEVAPGTAVMR